MIKIKIVKAFKYDKPFRRIIFNRHGYAKDLKRGIDESICNCNDGEFINYMDKDYGHVINGNLEILKDKELRKRMEHGTKYRMKRIVTKSAAIKLLTTNIDIFTQKLIYRYNLRRNVFDEWKVYVLRDLKRKYLKDYDGVSPEKHTKLTKSIKELQ